MKRNSKQLSLTHRGWAAPLWRQRRSWVEDKWRPWDKGSAAISIIVAFFPAIGNPLCPCELLNMQNWWWKLRHYCINVMPPFIFFLIKKIMGWNYCVSSSPFTSSTCPCGGKSIIHFAVRWNYNNNVPPVFDSRSLFFFFVFSLIASALHVAGLVATNTDTVCWWWQTLPHICFPIPLLQPCGKGAVLSKKTQKYMPNHPAPQPPQIHLLFGHLHKSIQTALSVTLKQKAAGSVFFFFFPAWTPF